MDTPLNRPSPEWLAAQTKVIQGWKAEDAAFASYCGNRDAGHSPESLQRFYNAKWFSDFERRYRDERDYKGQL